MKIRLVPICAVKLVLLASLKLAEIWSIFYRFTFQTFLKFVTIEVNDGKMYVLNSIWETTADTEASKNEETDRSCVESFELQYFT